MSAKLGRRQFLRRAGASVPIAAVTLLAAGSLPAVPDDATIESSADPDTVRLLTIGAALTGQMLPGLISDFETESGYTVEITTAGPDIMEQARTGTDIVMVHLGHTPLHDFVTEGRGLYPATIMSNLVVFLAPPNDPAGIKDLDDPYEAFAAIAASESPFIVNNLGETQYITDVVYEAAGRPDPGNWFRDPGVGGPQAVRLASQQGAYTIFGLHPFLGIQNSPQPVNLEAVVYNDTLLQRIIATTIVNRPPGKVNREGALALQDFLTDPATQARIRAFDLPNRPDVHGDGPLFWPAGNQNDN